MGWNVSYIWEGRTVYSYCAVLDNPEVPPAHPGVGTRVVLHEGTYHVVEVEVDHVIGTVQVFMEGA